VHLINKFLKENNKMVIDIINEILWNKETSFKASVGNLFFPFGVLSCSSSPTSTNIIKIYSNNYNNYYVRLWRLLLYKTFITVTRVVGLQGDFTLFCLGNSR